MRRTTSSLLLTAGLTIAVTGAIRPAMAQDSATELSDLREQVTDLQAREAEALRRVNELEARLARLESVRITDLESSRMRGTYIARQGWATPDDQALAYFQKGAEQASPGASSISDGIDEDDRKAPAPTEAETELTAQRQGRFGDRIGMELGLNYSHFDSARINLNGFLALDAIFLGSISIDQVTADIFSADPTLRVSLTDRLVMDASVPYLYRTSNFRSGGAGGNASGLVEERVSDQGFGDLNMGASYRLLRENLGQPDVVVTLRAKAPTGKHPYGVEFVDVANSEGNLAVPERLSTGSGVWGGSIGISALKTLDPMVVFGSLTYFHNFPRSFGDVDEAPGDQPGRVNVGNAYQLGAGLAYALNDRSSISMSYTQRIVEKSEVGLDEQEMRPIIGSQANVGLVNLGATFSLSKNLSLISTVGVGLTDDSPDMSVSLRLPYRF